jgi:pimeloyl-ACP methyl ester carboxylesterase
VHYRVAGKGTPWVVLEAGFPGGSSLDWTLVAPRIAEFTTVVTYDRAGIGWSAEGPPPRTGERIATVLRALLVALGATAPLVLVGHSGGGLIVRTFQQLYADLVSGIVLVDASHESQLSRIPDALRELRRMRRSLTSRLWLSRFRAARPFLARQLVSSAKRLLPPEALSACLSMEADSRFILTARREIDGIRESMRFLRNRSRPCETPTVVLTRGRDLSSLWSELQAEIAALFPLSKHRRLPGIGHDIHLEAPDEVVRAVREIVMGRLKPGGDCAP